MSDDSIRMTVEIGKVIPLRPKLGTEMAEPDTEARPPAHRLRNGHVTNRCKVFRHLAVVDYDERRVECSACGVELDPFQVLREVAHAEDWYRSLYDEKDRLMKEVAELKEERTKLKAAVRRARESAR